MERHLRFRNNGQQLLGVLTTPDERSRRGAGILFLHGWAGYRIGPHQMFTKLARRACAMGFPCLAFDFRGRGDSEGNAQDASISTMISDAQVAARVLRAEAGVEQITLVGVCSGGEVALGAGALIPEVDAMILWSVPQVAADRSHADRAKRFDIFRAYFGKLFRRETWAKLFAGGLNFMMIDRALRGGGKGAGEESAPEDKQIDYRHRFIEFRGGILFIYGSNDPTTPDCLAHYDTLSRKAGREFVSHVVEGANHSFYSLAWEKEVFDQSLGWLECRYPPAAVVVPDRAANPLPSGTPA